ncbi:ABC transporter permease [Nesterenkonia halotolerans]|uniref:Glycine betaine/proline transport system permease protein n=1 Tax=Nesterenkonia halotolerans TaxID=225325 RepID=A0ABR9J948_9MICC|nr:ABC transporter permease subunit [Nesterenkonia halotolerans]MBE1515524.1 glycine betaine/proline transport system permease protein [Nesterenkonia halotolerans]
MIAAAEETEGTGVPRLNVGEWIESGFDWLNDNLGGFLDLIRDSLTALVDGLDDLLNTPDAMLLAVVFALLAWLVRNWKLALLSFVLLVFIISVDQWEQAMATLALVIVAAALALLIGIPVGILAARSERVSTTVRPVMDLMQTMPAFVWLVPVVTLFSIGVAGAVIATVIFALPPGLRFAELGVRQVDPEVVEAGHAFGSTPWQILYKIQLPLALQTIMAGVNQVIMLALSMAVIAGLVGAGGLGGEVTRSIGSLDIGLGFEAGLSVVVLAIFLDRVTAAIGSGGVFSGRIAKLTRRRNDAEKSATRSRASAHM